MKISEKEMSDIRNQFSYLEQQKSSAELEAITLRNKFGEMSSSPPDNESELARLQLDCDKQLDAIYHNLCGHVLVKTPGGGDKWVEPNDDRLKILTQSGIYLIMNELKYHVNPITLLSNYTPEQIENIVLHFGKRMNHLLFNKAEFFYFHPSPEELYESSFKTIQLNPRQFLEFIDEKGNILEDDLYDKCLEWSSGELQSKFTHHESIVFDLTEIVYSTYLRAMGGQERKILREKQIFHTSQNIAPPQNTKQGWFR